jgi:hypothetical protein
MMTVRLHVPHCTRIFPPTVLNSRIAQFDFTRQIEDAKRRFVLVSRTLAAIQNRFLTEIVELIHLVSEKVVSSSPESALSRRFASEIVTSSLSRSTSWIHDYQHSGTLIVPGLDEVEDPKVRVFAEQVVEVGCQHAETTKFNARFRNCNVPHLA